MSPIEKMTFCFMEAIGRTLLRFPWLIWIEVKTLRCFELVLFQDDCPYFLGKLFSGNGFIPKCITKFQYARGVHLIQWVLVFFFSFSLFPSVLVQIGFCFETSRFSFFFFGRHYGETLCFFNILNIALFHDSVVCIDISARAFMVGFLKKNYVFWNWNKRNSHFPFKQIP